MNVNVLIDAIVRQTMILIAQLATASGSRATLAHVANQVFLDLVVELKAQGLGQKIIADMFGLALRTYHAKVRRLSESATDRGRSLWEAVLSYIQEEGLTSRNQVLERFARDDEMTVRGVLNDLVETGIVFKTGRGDRTAYRAASDEDLGLSGMLDPVETAANMVWVAINRYAPATSEELLAAVPMDEEDMVVALDRLVGDGRVVKTEQNGFATFSCHECVISFGASVGWEAAVFDHYQALVTAVCMKLDKGKTNALPSDAVGGSTYGFDVWQGHPMEDEVLGYLSQVRNDASELRARVEDYNAGVKPPADGPSRVIFYAGQTVLANESDEPGGET